MTAHCYRAQSPRIHLQCWHRKHLMFILWRRWDNPLSERHKHSTLGTWLLALSPIQPTWLQRTVGFIQDNSSPKMEHWEREDKRGNKTIWHFAYHNTAALLFNGRTHRCARQQTLGRVSLKFLNYRTMKVGENLICPKGNKKKVHQFYLQYIIQILN